MATYLVDSARTNGSRNTGSMVVAKTNYSASRERTNPTCIGGKEMEISTCMQTRIR